MKVLLVDAFNLLRRLYEGLPEERRSADAAVANSLNAFHRYLEEIGPSHCLWAFEAGGPTWRHRRYPPYKSQRPATPEPVLTAARQLEERLNAQGIATLRWPGVEADDVIASVAHTLDRHRVATVILSGDQGYAQLLSPQVVIYHPAAHEYRTAAWAEARFGVPVDRVRDLFALVGNAADDIPGVPGIGPKKAAALLDRWGAVDELLAHAEEIPGKQGELLRDYRDDLLLSRELVSLRTDLELGMNLREMKIPGGGG